MIEIIPYAAFSVPGGCQEIDAIFYAASATQCFASAAEKTAFHWRWLGRYLTQEPEHSFLAITPQNHVAGYLAGSISDPAKRPEFNELKYFQAFAHLTALYPAHFHVNIATKLRSGGVGTRLISAFAAHAIDSGATGMHIVTGRNARNVAFYRRNGFVELASTTHNDQDVVLFARRLTACDQV